MQTTTTRPARARKPAAQQLQFPDLPESDEPTFWLAAYLRDMAELDALKTLRDQVYRLKRCNPALRYAMTSAISAKLKESRESFSFLTAEGFLLCAFPETTAFEGGAA